MRLGSHRKLHLAAVCTLMRRALGLSLEKRELGCLERAEPRRLIKIASGHAIVNLLAGATEDPAIANCLDPDVVAFLDLMQDRNGARNAAFTAQLQEIGGILRDARIEAVALKGATELICRTYPRATDRLLGDLDILVPQGAIGDAVAALEASGYSTHGAVASPDSLHAPRLWHEAHPAAVEIHHALSRGRGVEILDPAQILRASTATRGCLLRVPALADRLCHLIVHAQMNHGRYQSRFLFLRDVADLQALSTRATAPTWTEVSARFAGAQAAPMLDAFLVAAFGVLQTPLPLATTPEAASWAEKAMFLLRRPEIHRCNYLFAMSRHYLGRFVSDQAARRRYLRYIRCSATLRDFVNQHVASVRDYQ
ncbi:MAG: nucleotidyltransferase family protein [Hyphomicrobiaceae bacterium]|nr:nucleotidyltransferase family protein [Hyphomicrobiaceae bacterium]